MLADIGGWIGGSFLFFFVATFAGVAMHEWLKNRQPHTKRRQLELELAQKNQEVMHLEEKIAELRTRDSQPVRGS